MIAGVIQLHVLSVIHSYNKTNCQRQLQLLPTISNFLKRIIHNQMYEHFNNNNLLAAQQYGFRKLHSTEYATVKLIDHVSKQMESQYTLYSLYRSFENFRYFVF